ncbi:MAG: DUF2218 domain-containing protein [Streptosporangiales bacterium]|nr:DUF2218 domain-containing protein [Streptosporangiales bacterium]
MESRSQITTERSARYVKQLCEHLGRRIEAEWDQGGGRLTFAFGTCELQATPGALTLHARAGDEESLARIEDVVGRHLERFGGRDELVVTWQRDGQSAGP